MDTQSKISDQPGENMALLAFLIFMYAVRQPVPINFLPQLVEIIKVAFPNVKMLSINLRDEDGHLHEFIYHNPTVSESATQLAVASISRREREEQQLYFDMGWALANLSCIVQLGGVRHADFKSTKLFPTACYIAVAAAALILTLPVLVRPNDLAPAVRKFMLLVAVFFLFLEYWFIKPHLSTE